MAGKADDDVTALAQQLATIAKAPSAQQPQLAKLAASLTALGQALAAGDGDAAARARAADELDRVRTQTLAVPGAPTGLVQTLELFAGWLRAPNAENTAAVERFVAALRAVPGGEALWTDQTAEAKRKAELDADVQKSLDEIAAGMPKLKL
ncbi:MAG: hypothetical protein JO257_20250 [Deltaproteobacteria bacterium]|nr:hypothetical protein [Deltaproteobacteria bacterium]